MTISVVGSAGREGGGKREGGAALTAGKNTITSIGEHAASREPFILWKREKTEKTHLSAPAKEEKKGVAPPEIL